MKVLGFFIFAIFVCNISIGEEINVESDFLPNAATFPSPGWYFGYNAAGDSAYVHVNDALIVDSAKGVIGFLACNKFTQSGAIGGSLIIEDSCFVEQLLDSCESPSCDGYYPCLWVEGCFQTNSTLNLVLAFRDIVKGEIHDVCRLFCDQVDTVQILLSIICSAKPGDVTGDGDVLLPDIVALINFLFRNQPAPSPLCRGDANGNGEVLLQDVIYLINYLFRFGPAPAKSGQCCL